MIAQDIMIREVHTVTADCTIREALNRMATLHVQSFPVVDQDQTLLGTLSFWQVLEQAMPPYITKGDLPDVRFAPDLAQLHQRLKDLQSQPVSFIMNPHPPCVRAQDSVLACAALIMKTPKTVYLLPVVEENRQLVGIIAAWDIIKKFVP